MNGGNVLAAYVHTDAVAYCWHESMLAVARWDGRHGSRIKDKLAIRCATDGLEEARNFGVQEFLKNSWDAEWLWWSDTDMGFPPETVGVLLAHADPQERAIVGGLCFARKLILPDGLGGYATVTVPTIYDWRQTGDLWGPLPRAEYPSNQLVRCDATGSACILIHRSVFERIQAEWGEVWYDRIPNITLDGKPMSEDLSFCWRAGQLGYSTWVHTGLQTDHQKVVWLNEASHQLMRSGLEALVAGAPVSA